MIRSLFASVLDDGTAEAVAALGLIGLCIRMTPDAVDDRVELPLELPWVIS